MIILDTNVVSEPLRPAPAPEVVVWLDDQIIETLHLTAISVAELRFGVAALPSGRRQRSLREALEDAVLPLFAGRVLAFDEPAALAYADLRARARAHGRAIATVDAYIAAIATAHGFAVATRDVSPFESVGVPVVNPFRPGQS